MLMDMFFFLKIGQKFAGQVGSVASMIDAPPRWICIYNSLRPLRQTSTEAFDIAAFVDVFADAPEPTPKFSVSLFA